MQFTGFFSLARRYFNFCSLELIELHWRSLLWFCDCCPSFPQNKYYGNSQPSEISHFENLNPVITTRHRVGSNAFFCSLQKNLLWFRVTAIDLNCYVCWDQVAASAAPCLNGPPEVPLMSLPVATQRATDRFAFGVPEGIAENCSWGYPDIWMCCRKNGSTLENGHKSKNVEQYKVLVYLMCVPSHWKVCFMFSTFLPKLNTVKLKTQL